MRTHRFYIEPHAKLKQHFWLHDENLLNQWNKVLRFQPGQQVVLFDGLEHDRLYKLITLSPKEAELELVTEYHRKLPKHKLTLFWSLLKKDKNDWVLQKCTELGVSHFVPLLAERSEKTGFNGERARKIVIEASEQCGRSDIPSIREPLLVETAVNTYQNKLVLYMCEQSAKESDISEGKPAGVLIGPEGGWSDSEKALFESQKIRHLNLHDFTLRAETACVAATAKLIQ